MNNIPFGSLVQDKISGFKGVVVFRAEHMNSCIRYGVQPALDKEGKMPESKVFDGPNLEIIAPPKADFPTAIETPDAFKLGVKVKDRIAGLTGITLVRIKTRHAGDRYGIQPPVDKKGELPEIVTFDEEDLEQIDPPPTPKEKIAQAKKPNGPHDHSTKLTR